MICLGEHGLILGLCNCISRRICTIQEANSFIAFETIYGIGSLPDSVNARRSRPLLPYGPQNPVWF